MGIAVRIVDVGVAVLVAADVVEVDFRVISRRNGFELGGGWVKTARSTGAEYVSVSLSAPELGEIFCNVANAPGDDPSKKVLIWNAPN